MIGCNDKKSHDEEDNYLLVESWKAAGVLQPLLPEMVPLFWRALLVACFDARFVLKWYRQMVDIASSKQKQESPQIFPFIMPGAPLWVAPLPPHNEMDFRGLVEFTLNIAQENGCNHAVIMGHYECAAGKKCGIGLAGNAARTIAGARHLMKKGFKQVATLFDIKKQGDDVIPDPWYLDPTAFKEWCLSRQPEIISQYPGICRHDATV